MEQNQNLLNNELTIDPVAYAHLKETAMWARFLGILGFIMSGLLLLVALFAGSFLSSFQRSAGPYSGAENPLMSMGAGFITVLYIIIAAISFIFCTNFSCIPARGGSVMMTSGRPCFSKKASSHILMTSPA